MTTSTAATAVRIPKPGDRFSFHDLDGDLDGRHMVVRGISVSGRLQFTIGFLGEPARGIHDAGLADVLAMIEAGIWVLQDDATGDAAGEANGPTYRQD